MERQKIIERAINIENIISILITFHYFPEKEKGINGNFLQDVLYDPHATVAFKVNLLQKCFPEYGEKNIQKIRRIFNIRNIFAHCGLKMSSSVDPKNFSAIDPKKKNEPLDYESLTNEFNKEADNQEKNLIALAKQRGIPLSAEQGQYS
jgi:hypothetical protein